MNAFTRDDFVTWMERLAHVPWPLTLDAFTDLASELGWTFTGYQYSFTADFAAGKRDVVVLKNRAGDVRSISFILVEPALEGIALRAALNDSFIDYVTSASQAWGKPIRAIPVHYEQDPTGLEGTRSSSAHNTIVRHASR